MGLWSPMDTLRGEGVIMMDWIAMEEEEVLEIIEEILEQMEA